MVEAAMCLRTQGIDENDGGVGEGRQARGLSNNDEGVGRRRGIDDTSEGLETMTEATGDQRRD